MIAHAIRTPTKSCEGRFYAQPRIPQTVKPSLLQQGFFRLLVATNIILQALLHTSEDGACTHKLSCTWRKDGDSGEYLCCNRYHAHPGLPKTLPLAGDVLCRSQTIYEASGSGPKCSDHGLTQDCRNPHLRKVRAFCPITASTSRVQRESKRCMKTSEVLGA